MNSQLYDGANYSLKSYKLETLLAMSFNLLALCTALLVLDVKKSSGLDDIPANVLRY